jgi:regulator of sigma E protease
MELLTTVLAFLLALAILIVVHEMGHYLVARRCGVKVLRFSVGFGRPLLRRQVGPDRTEWVISAIPYGGYVKMLDERDPDCLPMSEADKPRAFNRQSVGKRAAIVVAGPLANLLLAIALYWVINLVGTLEPVPYLGPPPAGTPAAQAGLADGDLVLAFNGSAVQSWSDLRWALLQGGVSGGGAGNGAGSGAGGGARLTVRDLDGREREVRLDLSSGRAGEIDDAWFDQLGMVHGAGSATIRGVLDGSVAAQAGLAAGDRIVTIDGTPVRTAAEVTRLVRASAGRPQTWEIIRANAAADVPENGVSGTDSTAPASSPAISRAGPPALEKRVLTPAAVTLEDGSTIGRVGIDFMQTRMVRYAPLPALLRAAGRTWDTSIFSLKMVGRMLDGRASWRNLSGPVSIADVAGQTARIGLIPYLSFLALVSISLGVLNLMPIPVLDGGQLLYYAVEVIKGSPPSVRTVELAQRLGVGMLLILTALALYNDLTRLLS